MSDPTILQNQVAARTNANPAMTDTGGALFDHKPIKNVWMQRVMLRLRSLWISAVKCSSRSGREFSTPFKFSRQFTVTGCRNLIGIWPLFAVRMVE